MSSSVGGHMCTLGFKWLSSVRVSRWAVWFLGRAHEFELAADWPFFHSCYGKTLCTRNLFLREMNSSTGCSLNENNYIWYGTEKEVRRKGKKNANGSEKFSNSFWILLAALMFICKTFSIISLSQGSLFFALLLVLFLPCGLMKWWKLSQLHFTLPFWLTN